MHAQTTQESTADQIQKLTDAMAKAQSQLEESQRQLEEMRRQLNLLRQQLAPSSASTTPPPSPSNAAAIDDLRERQAMQESQIATHEQDKVETTSKYPLKITGLLLFNSFINAGAVDMAATPTTALPGAGSTGASIRQTILGFEAHGPHFLGAKSFADLNVDFNGSAPSTDAAASYSGYYNGNQSFLRLRTAHAGLQWDHTSAYFALDRPILSPDTPTSLTAVAEPALAWSGNLWTWNPQLGITHDVILPNQSAIRLQAAIIDVGDPPVSLATSSTTTVPSTEEQSRVPGVEARIAVLGSKLDEGSHLGFGGYFSPHLSPLNRRFDAWAGTMDAKLLLPARFKFTGSFYRGEALGGLGAGAFKDLAYIYSDATASYHARPLDDVGGWAQLRQKLTPRVAFDAAFGIDNVFSKELRRYIVPNGSVYQNLARNRTFTGNAIYSPSASLLFSVEYRHLFSVPIAGPAANSNVIGIAAGYVF